MNKLCRKDVLKNRLLLMALLGVNIFYMMIHFCKGFAFEDVRWGLEIFYVLFIAMIIPPMLFCRYGDSNRLIIQNVIQPKLAKIQPYYFCYLLWLLLILVGIIASMTLFLPFSHIFSLKRQLLFICHMAIVTSIYIMIFVSLVNFLNRFLFAWVAYLVIIFLLIVFHAPTSFLWFIYTKDYPTNQHWIGKGILFAIIFICFQGASLYSLRKRSR